MFKIDVTFEDTRIEAKSDFGFAWECEVFDNFKGDSKQVTLSHQQLSYVIQFLLDPDGEPEGFEKMYVELEPIFKGWPNNLRPIP